MLYHSNSNHNIAGVSILITNKIDLKWRNVTRGKRSKDKWSIHQEYITIINTYAPYN